MNSRLLVGKKKQNMAVDSRKQGGSRNFSLVLGDRSAETFKPLWKILRGWQCFLYVTDGYGVYPCFINDADHLVSKTYMTRVEGENTRLRHYLARLHRRTLCYSKTEEMLRLSIKLLLHYLKDGVVPLPL
jgi:IS1 family transposase